MYSFWKLTPGGNPTIFLNAADVPPAQRAAVANAVMDPQHIGAEQVGYIRFEGIPRLDMMGGEFCLNATRSFALLLAEKGLLSKIGNDGYYGSVEVSGVPCSVPVHVVRSTNALPFAEACLHFSSLPQPIACPGNTLLIRVPGISHIIQSGEIPEASKLRLFCEDQRRICQVEREEAVGHLWLRGNTENNAEGCAELFPVVWVRDTGSLCRETACGSGTLASALALHARTRLCRFRILQPSGFSLSVRMESQDDGWNVWVGGPVRLTACGETDLTGIL